MLAEPAHWCSGLGTLLLNEWVGVRIPVDALFFFFFSLKFSKFNSRGQRSLPVQEASQVGNRYRRSSNVVKHSFLDLFGNFRGIYFRCMHYDALSLASDRIASYPAVAVVSLLFSCYHTSTKV